MPIIILLYTLISIIYNLKIEKIKTGIEGSKCEDREYSFCSRLRVRRNKY